MSDLPKGWTRATLDAIADVLDFEREPINSSDRESRVTGKNEADLYPYYGATGQVGLIDSFRSEGQRVLLGEDAVPFLDPIKDKAYLANGRFWVNNHAHILAGAGGLIDNKFLCHQLNTVDYHPFVTGSTRLKLTSSAMKQIPMVVAPAAEQTRIVAKLEELLSDLDAGVVELKVAQRKLAQYRQSLLKAAVEGALTAEWRAKHAPTETGAQLLERILTERRARWEAKQLAKFKEQGKTPPKDWQKKYPEPVQPDTSGLPDLPQGWVYASLDQLLVQLRSGCAETSSREVTGFPVLKSSAVRPGSIDYSALNYLTSAQSRAENRLESGDLLISRLSGSVEYVGCCAQVNELPSHGVQYPDRLFCGKPVAHTETLGSHIVICLSGPYARAKIEKAAKSTAGHKRISLSDLHPFAIAIPPLREARESVRFVQTTLGEIARQESAIKLALKQANAQRQNILRAAFAGQLLPQDPADEPASVLLERIRAERAEHESAKKPRGRKARDSVR